MRRSYAQSGMTLFEILVVLATVIILAGALVGVGKHVVHRAYVDLTESAIEVIVTALEQYYADFDVFPLLYSDVNANGVYDAPPDTLDYTESELEYSLVALTGLSGVVAPDNAIDDLDTGTGEVASSTALFYYLDRAPNSRKIIEALAESLITNKDTNGNKIVFTDSVETIDLPRFVDAWGVSIRYQYLPDTAFPTLTSAGPDKKFGTADDITSK